MCPGTPGLDDPLCNPFSEAVGGNATHVEHVLVYIAKDSLRDELIALFRL
jgi:hypothetical protein